MKKEICMFIALIAIKEACAVFRYHKELMAMHDDLLQLNSNIFYNLEIEISYPFDSMECKGPHIKIFDREGKYFYKLILNKKTGILRIIFYSQDGNGYIFGSYLYKSQLKLSLSISKWKDEIEWNDGKVTLPYYYDRNGLALIIVQENCQPDQIAIKEYFSGKEIQYLTVDKRPKFGKSANNSIGQMETVAKNLLYQDEQQRTLLKVFRKIDEILILGAVLAIVINCVMVTIEIRSYQLYELAKCRTLKPVLTKEFLKKIRIERYDAKKLAPDTFFFFQNEDELNVLTCKQTLMFGRVNNIQESRIDKSNFVKN